MNKLSVLPSTVFVAVVIALSTPGLALAESFTLHQALRRVMQTYPSVEIARLQARRAQQDVVKAKSLLGWSLAGQVGASRDLSPFSGTPSDRIDATAGLERALSSGGTLGRSEEHTSELQSH